MRETVLASQLDGATPDVIAREALLARLRDGDGKAVKRFDGATQAQRAQGGL